ncbi:carbohydrate kinase family protein [Paenibacillus sp. Soil787]|uniref:carbohydrate kinase family protein n=1 Tax=Paenibacillus sp. Soil787 TaxID=1736411 RepID=UPI0006FF8080|nr:carbohydrate kinase [Paenibacillus sp. Soil787]KRF42166.1 sugar kinase [Paenibacillus sp. Soil787]
MYDVVALGEVLIDFTPAGKSELDYALFERNPGGAPANVLAALAKWGKQTALISKVGLDQHGQYLIETLQQCGIDTRGVVTSTDTNTTLAFVHLDSRGDRSFSFYRNPGADTMLGENEVLLELIEQSKLFHFGSLSLTNEPAASATKKALLFAKDKGCIISFDPNLRIALWTDLGYARKQIEYGLARADIVKLSEEELLFLTGVNDLEEGSRMICDSFGPSLILITLAEKGAFYRFGYTTGIVAGFEVNAIDSTGAGDAFFGGFLNTWIEMKMTFDVLGENELRSMIRFANAAGALATTRRGAIPAMPSIEEIRKVTKDNDNS